jgi:hypothetical protein
MDDWSCLPACLPAPPAPRFTCTCPACFSSVSGVPTNLTCKPDCPLAQCVTAVGVCMPGPSSGGGGGGGGGSAAGGGGGGGSKGSGETPGLGVTLLSPTVHDDTSSLSNRSMMICKLQQGCRTTLCICKWYQMLHCHSSLSACVQPGT